MPFVAKWSTRSVKAVKKPKKIWKKAKKPKVLPKKRKPKVVKKSKPKIIGHPSLPVKPVGRMYGELPRVTCTV